MKQQIKNKRAAARRQPDRSLARDVASQASAMAGYAAARERYVPLSVRNWPAPAVASSATATG